jgi:plastocyanin
MRLRTAAVLAATAALVAPAGSIAVEDGPTVSMAYAAFQPPQLTALAGETVMWHNQSFRAHTVTADDGSFDSGDLASGATFAVTAPAGPGMYMYHCRIHAGMTGELDVRRVILAPLPIAPVPAGQPVQLSGRTADPQSPVSIEADLGAGFHAVATAQPAADGSWKATVPAQTTGDFRAVSGLDISETRRLLVLDRRVEIRATKHGVHVAVTPALPYGRLLLERRTRERFGWYPVARKRLDYLSRADFTISRPATVRVSIVDKDRWTSLATSPALHLRAARR